MVWPQCWNDTGRFSPSRIKFFSHKEYLYRGWLHEDALCRNACFSLHSEPLAKEATPAPSSSWYSWMSLLQDYKWSSASLSSTRGMTDAPAPKHLYTATVLYKAGLSACEREVGTWEPGRRWISSPCQLNRPKLRNPRNEPWG